MLTSKFDYHLPKELIAQKPMKPRDHSRLLILDRQTGKTIHKRFYNIVDYLEPGDVLVLNNSKVIPARLIGKKESGGEREIFLLTKIKPYTWQCLIRGKVKPDIKIILPKNIIAYLIKKYDEQLWEIKFNKSDKKLFSIGETPLPPYIKKRHSRMSLSADYQTVYAKTAGSVAAPTAGLHFTKRLLNQLKKKGVKVRYITLHVGLGTFAPVKTKDITKHKMHSEFTSIDKKTANALNQAKKQGKKIIAVGTTAVRTLEAFAIKTLPATSLQAGSKWVNIFIFPGYKFKFVDEIITNFHLPKSTLLMLVSAFAEDISPLSRRNIAKRKGGCRSKHCYSGTVIILKTYQQAIAKKYRFYSFGDVMLII